MIDELNKMKWHTLPLITGSQAGILTISLTISQIEFSLTETSTNGYPNMFGMGNYAD